MPAGGLTILLAAGAGIGIAAVEEEAEEEEGLSVLRVVQGLLAPSRCVSVHVILGLCTHFWEPLSCPFFLGPPLVFPFVVWARLLRASLPSSHE